MGTKIVYTRHDAIPHYCTDKNKLELYRIVETQSNAIIHLGEYSRQEFARIYPENTARHFVIPHHIYDSCGYAFPSKLTSRNKVWDYRPINSSFSLLGVTATKKNSALSSMLSSIYPCQISSYWLPVSTTVVLPTVKHPYKICCDTELKKRNSGSTRIEPLQLHEKISNTELPYYFSATDIVLIQRKEILNSGNVPMALFFHKVVAGPNSGISANFSI